MLFRQDYLSQSPFSLRSSCLCCSSRPTGRKLYSSRRAYCCVVVGFCSSLCSVHVAFSKVCLKAYFCRGDGCVISRKTSERTASRGSWRRKVFEECFLLLQRAAPNNKPVLYQNLVSKIRLFTSFKSFSKPNIFSGSYNSDFPSTWWHFSAARFLPFYGQLFRENV